MRMDAAGPAPLIDCHAHVWDGSTPFVSTAWKRPDYIYPVEKWLADMDAHDVRYGVIAAASLFGTNNSYALRVLRQHPRLRATANVELAADMEELRALRTAGIVGIRLQWFFLESLPDMAGGFRKFCHRLRDLDMHIHLNINGARLLDVSRRVLDTGVKFVIDHFGWHDPALRLAAPSYQGMLKLLERDNAWVKMTSGFRHPDEHHPDWSLPVEYAQDLLQRFGPAKLLWGSDAPFIGHEHVASYPLAIERFRQCVPDPAMQRAIGNNGYSFYFGA